MKNADYYISKFLNEVQYSVEHMSATHWIIVGSMAMVLSILFLRGTNVNV